MEIPPPLTPPHKGGGDFAPCRVAQISTILAGKAAPASPSPLWGGDRGGGKKPRKFHMRLPCHKGEGEGATSSSPRLAPPPASRSGRGRASRRRNRARLPRRSGWRTGRRHARRRCRA